MKLKLKLLKEFKKYVYIIIETQLLLLDNIYHFLCPKHCSKGFSCDKLFSLYNNTMR